MVDNEKGLNENSLEWNRHSVRALRLRLGWSKSDMARRLKCTLTEVDSWEDGTQQIEMQTQGELEIMFRQCEACSEEVKYTPASEVELDKNALEQIEFSRVKANLE